jgi:hypothetical protein
MANEPIEELWSQWQQEKLPPERAVGQLIQLLRALIKEVAALKQQVAQLARRLKD